jgi:hypothetical protein
MVGNQIIAYLNHNASNHDLMKGLSYLKNQRIKKEKLRKNMMKLVRKYLKCKGKIDCHI